jgi:MYXO-CTERM domain-containing protein
MRLPLVALTLTIATGTAAALEQSAHRDISKGTCLAYGLPYEFCEQVGVETYNVDSYEWNDLSAHSQIDSGQTECQAANNALNRVRWLAGQMRATMWDLSFASSEAGAGRLAQHLGRALHTIQDNCAHAGMPNPQHAWWSLADSCHGTKWSPDAQPAATACAITETRAVFDAFVDALAETGVERESLADTDGTWTHWPGRGDVCSFLRGSDSWDGVDRRWDNTKVVPALRTQIVSALSGDDTWRPVCAQGWDDIRVANPPPYSTAAGQKRCFKISVYCIGKADDGTTPPDAPPPWSADGTAADASAGQGCSVATDTPHATPAVLMILALALYWRLVHRRR